MSGIFDQVINYAPPSLLKGTVTYKGTWSAATNTPTLINPPDSTTNGHYYVVSAAGTQFSLSFNIGDWIISNGSAWEKVDNTDAVSSVFGRTGAVVGVSTDYSAVGITATAVGASSPSTGAFTTLSATTPLAVASGGTGVASSTGTTNVVLSGSPTITTPVIAQINDAAGNATVRLTGITSATDYLEIKNGIGVGSPLHVLAEGTSANIGMHVQPKGTGLLTISDGVDFNKGIRFRSVSSAASAVTLIDAVSTAGRVITLPDATDTLVGKATTDTLTNKTLTSPTITGGALNGTLGATTPSSVAATTGTFSSTLGVTGVATLGNGAILGTPASGTVTNLTGTASININGTVGATTPSTIAATTISGSGTATIGPGGVGNGNGIVNINGGSGATGGPYLALQANGSNISRLGSEAGILGSGSTTKTIFFGQSAGLDIYANGGLVSTFTTTGLNSTAIGATTPSTGAFSTLSATGAISSTYGGQVANFQPTTGTNGSYLRFANTGGAAYVGLDNSTGGALGNGNYVFNIYSDTEIVLARNGERLRVSSSGVAITGTLSATGQIQAPYGSFTTQAIQVGDSSYGLYIDSGIFHFKNANGGTFNFRNAGNTGNTVSIDSNGLAVTGALSATGNLTISNAGRGLLCGYTGATGSAFTNTDDTSNSQFVVFTKSNGGTIGSISRVTTTDAVVYNTTSDARLKENLRDFTDSGRLIDALKPRVFDWKGDTDGNGKDVIGFIAQEEYAADPVFAHIGAVSVGDDDPTTITKQWQRSDAALIPILVAELQSLRKRLAALESK